MTGLTITNIQSSESLEMIETQTGRWNTQGDRLADHLCLDIVIIVTQLKTQNTTITLLTSPWCIQDYKQPATN